MSNEPSGLSRLAISFHSSPRIIHADVALHNLVDLHTELLIYFLTDYHRVDEQCQYESTRH